MKTIYINKKFLVKKYSIEKYSATDIAFLLSCTATTVYNYMKKYKIERRNPSEANKLIIYKIIKMLKNRKGKNNPMFGKYHSKKTKTIQSQQKLGIKNPMYGKREEASPTWNGGSSFDIYPIEWTNELKEKVRKRDKHQCQLCGIKQEDYYRKLDVHHIDYDKSNCKEDNLITLCWKCNSKVNYNRDYWYAYFTYILENSLLYLEVL